MKTTVLSTIFVAFLCLLCSFRSMATTVYTPEASGTVTYGNDKAVIDASHASEGYLMIRYTGSNPTIRLRVVKNTTHIYILNSSGQYETLPLTEGSGTYSVEVFELVSGTQYMQVANESVPVTLFSGTKPFLYLNQFCNFNTNSAVVSQADAITPGISELPDKVAAIYDYTVGTITYDNEKARAVQSDHLPNPDTTLNQRSGICFDYASLMTSMLRSQNIPIRLVIGHTDDIYHARVSIYIQSQGWIDNVIYFDGTSWKFMGPTFVFSGEESQEAPDYVGNPAHYIAKFTY